jgi:hypothetical protein
VALGNPRIPLRRLVPGRPYVATAPTAADLHLGEWFLYLDLPGNPRFPGCGYARDFVRFLGNRPSVAYARVTTDPYERALVVQYWVFYYFNGGANPHEGDWELIQLSFADTTSAGQALAREPTSMAVSQHGGGERAAWDDEKVETRSGRPVVYVARGSHANHFQPRLFVGLGEDRREFACDDASDPLRPVVPRVVLLPEGDPGRTDPLAWVTFRGHWGERQAWFFDSPTGPIRKPAWTRPAAWERSLRSDSVVVPGGARLGPSATDAFCAAVRVVSGFLGLRATWPIPTMAASALVAAAILALVVWAGRRRRPLNGALVRSNWRLLGDAASLYGRHPLAFLGIGLGFVPVALAATAVQSLVFSSTPIGPLLELVPDDRIVGGAVAFGLASLAYVFAYVVIAAAVAAAIREVAAGNRPRPVACTGHALRQLHRLVAANAVAGLTVLALALSVVGIPLALRQFVRWSFVQPAIVLDGARSLGALGLSSRAVEGNWLRTMVLSSGLVVFSVVTGPIAGMVLLLFVPELLGVIDLASSALYVAIVPFVAIARTLLYQDLTRALRATQPVSPTP